MAEFGPLKSRYDFAEYCNQLNLTGWAVEIGSDRGYFAKRFVEKWHGHSFYCVDPYEDNLAGYNDDIRWPREPDMQLAIAALAPYHDKVRFIRLTSEKACTALSYMSPHFVYIDGNHDYEYVKQDIELWWPRLRDGGVLAGHDYSLHTPGVGKAVEEFFAPLGLKVMLTRENEYKSWHVRKPG